MCMWPISEASCFKGKAEVRAWWAQPWSLPCVLGSQRTAMTRGAALLACRRACAPCCRFAHNILLSIGVSAGVSDVAQHVPLPPRDRQGPRVGRGRLLSDGWVRHCRCWLQSGHSPSARASLLYMRPTMALHPPCACAWVACDWRHDSASSCCTPCCDRALLPHADVCASADCAHSLLQHW